MSQYTSYYLYQKYVSYDNGSTWTPVYPEEYSISGDSSDPQTITKKQDNDPECGYTPPVIPQFRWVEDGDNYICDDCYCIQYLTFRALESGTFSFTNSGMSYSLDSGSTWNTLSASANTPTVQSGSTIMWKGTLSASSSNGIGRFSSTGQFELEGNIMSMKYGDNFSGQTTLPDEYSFKSLFSGCTGLASAENLVLPATSLTTSCYYSMFRGCTSLTSAPELPATTLAEGCYNAMFQNCTSLTTAPTLSATTLTNGCYWGMFWGCTSLTTAPELPSTTLARDCYFRMFYGCTSLTTAPVLPATTLAEDCYKYMFFLCSSLTTAPELPVTTLAKGCYAGMFRGCTSLTTAPELPATTLTESCYSAMFRECENLSEITCLATDISANDCTGNWVRGVASSGTFYKNPSMSSWPTGDSGIPSNWTVQDYQG